MPAGTILGALGPVALSAPLIGAVPGDIVRDLVSLAVLLVFATIMGFRMVSPPSWASAS